MISKTVSIAAKMEIDQFFFRPLKTSDLDALRELHDELFPIEYSINFFNDAVQGIGLFGGDLYNLAMFDKNSSNPDQLMGFILAQVFEDNIHYNDASLFNSLFGIPHKVCYILTLGFRPEYRRSGLGTVLIKKLLNYLLYSEKDCGILYLHVITTNVPALKFYQNNDFIKIKEIADFYCIDNINYDAHVYGYYINGYKPPLLSQFNKFFNYIFFKRFKCISNNEINDNNNHNKNKEEGKDQNKADVEIKCGVKIIKKMNNNNKNNNNDDDESKE